MLQTMQQLATLSHDFYAEHASLFTKHMSLTPALLDYMLMAWRSICWRLLALMRQRLAAS